MNVPLGGTMDKRAILAAVAVLTSSCTLRPDLAFDERAAPGQFGSVAIADRDDALTFARIGRGADRRVIAVTRYRAGRVEGVDLSGLLGRPVADPIAMHLEYGYAALKDRIEHAPASARVSVPSADLRAPVDLRARHIAAGANFPAHAAEADLKDEPFLFCKLVEPTGARAGVSVGGGLLDYEVELAYVPLRPVIEGRRPAEMGLILCNDYSDRATLLRGVDVHDVASGKGFATGKSFPGYLPVGDLFVIPRRFRDFARRLTLQLYVNDQLRQREPVGAAVWDVDRIIEETWKRRSVTWRHKGRDVSLLGGERAIRARTLIMSGTPRGVVFHGVPAPQRLAGLLSWLAGGWGRPIEAHVIEAYIRAARSARLYLQPGDRVTIHVDRLGVIDNPIEP